MNKYIFILCAPVCILPELNLKNLKNFSNLGLMFDILIQLNSSRRTLSSQALLNE